MKAYKVFNSNWACQDFQYEVGKEYKIDSEPILCKRGFHACKKLVDCFNYYDFDSANKVAEVELLGTVIGDEEDKQVTNHIKIVRELTWYEVLHLVNIGNCNTGYKKPCKISIWENARKPKFIYFFLEEGKTYKECFKNSYLRAKKQDDWEYQKELLLNLPNFDKQVFFEISGIEI